jgi:hypothetical protein
VAIKRKAFAFLKGDIMGQNEITLTKIRQDLKDIRYYYSRKEMFDKELKDVAANSILDKVQKYNGAMSLAAPRLYDLYVSLYVKNFTQESLAFDLGYTPEYIQMQNKKLLLFLQSQLG